MIRDITDGDSVRPVETTRAAPCSLATNLDRRAEASRITHVQGGSHGASSEQLQRATAQDATALAHEGNGAQSKPQSAPPTDHPTCTKSAHTGNSFKGVETWKAILLQAFKSDQG